MACASGDSPKYQATICGAKITPATNNTKNSLVQKMDNIRDLDFVHIAVPPLFFCFYSSTLEIVLQYIFIVFQ